MADQIIYSGGGRYTLDDNRKPVACDDLLLWARWMNTVDRSVALTQLGDVKVSTVFLAMDHQFGAGPPLLFETMVFGGDNDGHMERCSTWDEAESQHDRVVAMLRSAGGGA